MTEQQTPISQQVTPPSGGQNLTNPPSPVVEDIKKVKSLMAKLKDLGSIVREKLKSGDKNTRTLIIVGTVFLVTVLLLVVVGVVKNMSGVKTAVKIVATPTPAPAATIVPQEITNPSRYATDSAVVKMREDIGTLGREMDSIDLKEANLRIPTLDFDVKFSQ